MAPAVIAVISIVATVASTVYSAVSSNQAQSRAAHREEKRANAAAARAREIAGQKAEDFRRRSIAALGSERAARGASGITMEGSPLLTYYENMKNYERDIERIKEGGEVEASGWLAKAYESRQSMPSDAGLYAGIGSTLLTGATSVFETGQKAGWWGGKGVV